MADCGGDSGSAIATIVAAIAAIPGIVALIWRIYDHFGEYLRIDLKIQRATHLALALTTVDNKSSKPRRIDYAVLLIGPEDENPIDTLKMLAPVAELDPNEIAHTNDFDLFPEDFSHYDGVGRAYLSLDFYYDENLDIADETLRYTQSIDLKKLNASSTSSVRFFVSEEDRLHRSTHALIAP